MPAVIATAQMRDRLGLSRPVSALVAAIAPVAALMARPPGRWPRAAVIWCAHMWAYKTCFEIPYDKPELLYRRVRVDPPIRVDSIIGLGRPPGQRLQERLRRPPQLTGLDRAATAVYLLWELEPHLALAWILARHPDRFRFSTLQLGLTFDLTLVGYVLFPMAPPWWASEREGRMRGSIRRVTLEVMADAKGDPRPRSDHTAGANPWASMPSDHFASAIAAASALAEVDRTAGALGYSYALLLGAALVYTGEHYVVDLLAGLGVALVGRAGGRRAERGLERLVRHGLRLDR